MANIKQIAHLSGVSRGTVDRVLNNRGAVKHETRERVLKIAEELNYTPNRIAKTLAIKKKNLKFGFILFGSTEGNPFFEDVVLGIKKKALELEEYGITVQVRNTDLGNPDKQVEIIDELVSCGVSGIALMPINHPLVCDKIAELKRKGIPVVTANSDIEHSDRIAYVGSDCVRGGETAAGLMNLITKGEANIGVLIGSRHVVGHTERMQGFSSHVAKSFPNIKIIDIASNNDDNNVSFEVTTKMLTEHPEIDALFLASAGVEGAHKAIEALGLAGRLRIVSFDATPPTRKMLKDGIISATLGQQPELQGSKPLDILLDYLGLGIAPSKEFYFTKIEIFIRENID